MCLRHCSIKIYKITFLTEIANILRFYRLLFLHFFQKAVYKVKNCEKVTINGSLKIAI